MLCLGDFLWWHSWGCFNSWLRFTRRRAAVCAAVRIRSGASRGEHVWVFLFVMIATLLLVWDASFGGALLFVPQLFNFVRIRWGADEISGEFYFITLHWEAARAAVRAPALGFRSHQVRCLP